MSPNASKRKAPSRKAPPMLGLACTQEGRTKKTLGNVMTVLGSHPEWQGVLAYDAFAETVVCTRPPPTRQQDTPAEHVAGDWNEEDSIRTAAWFGEEIGIDPAPDMVEQGVLAIAKRRIVHPVRDYLQSVEWDGVGRLDPMLPKYFGTAETAYTRAVGSRWMISAVARVFKPGCQADCMLVLESERQGIGKSTGLEALAGQQWFADTGIDVGAKDSYQALRRKWIYEFGELDSIKGREVTRVKNFISARTDNYRPSYGRRNRDFPRQVVFCGTTNESEYLVDHTGGRRFWPVRCERDVDVRAIKLDRDQLWAEARARYEAGEAWHVDTPELRAMCEAEQARREEQDDWIEIVGRWLKAPTRPDGHGHSAREIIKLNDGITTADVLLGALGFAADRINGGATKRVGHVLRSLGFLPHRQREAGQRVRRYFPTWDSTWATEPAQNKPLSPVPGVPCDFHTGEREQGTGLHTVSGKQPGPPGTWDSDDDPDERSAIQSEALW